MRRVFVFTLTIFLLIGFASSAQTTSAAEVTSQEWGWIDAYQTAETANDAAGMIQYARLLVDSLKGHNPSACGHYAQLLGRSLDQQELYNEAYAAFQDEFVCWGQFPDRAEWMRADQLRAEQIKPEVDLYVARPTRGEPTGRLAKQEPAFGTMLGGTIDWDPAVAGDFSKVADAYGKSYAILLVYPDWGQDLPVHLTNQARKVNGAIQVAWQPQQGLDAVQDDAYVHRFAQQLRDFGGPVYLSFGREMNGAWVPWYDDPAKYIAKFRLIAAIMHREAPNVAMVWAPNYVGDTPYEAFYPGDDAVDWVGVNVYYDPYFMGNPNARQIDADLFHAGKRANPLDPIKEIYQEYAARKPIMIAETGFGWANTKPYIEEVQWAAATLKRFYGYAPLLYPRLKAVSYFNTHVATDSAFYTLSGKPEMVEAYKQATGPDWYLGSPSAQPTTFWRPADQATLSGPTRVAVYANLGGGVSRVEYRLDGRSVASSTQLPWVASMDLSGLTGSHTITVVAYDGKGRPGSSRDYTFDASAIRVDLNGRILDFDQPPVNVNGRVLVPVRTIMEALGAEVTWDQASHTVIAHKDGSELRLQIGNPVPLKDGKPLAALDVPAQIIGGRTLVPTRFVAESFEMEVRWESDIRTVVIQPAP
ncbi:MAG: stalk domain-containing protein [Mycobacterium leprae]